MTESSTFVAHTAVTSDGDGRYEAVIDPSWWIIRGPNGGYLAAIIARAIVAEVAEPDQRLRSLTLHYLRAPVAGPATVEVTVERRGRTLTSVHARMVQDGRLMITALAAVAGRRDGPSFSHLEIPDVEPPADPHPEPLPPPAGLPPSERPVPPMRDHYEMQQRIGPDRIAGETTDEAVTGGWIRLADAQPVDEIVVTAIADAWMPAIFSKIADPLGVPTVDLTIHFRDPAPDVVDWTFVRFTSRHAVDGYVEEDGELWSSEGRLLAQCRQLAVELPMVSPDS